MTINISIAPYERMALFLITPTYSTYVTTIYIYIYCFQLHFFFGGERGGRQADVEMFAKEGEGGGEGGGWVVVFAFIFHCFAAHSSEGRITALAQPELRNKTNAQSTART